MLGLLNRIQNILDSTRAVDFLAPLALRAYLVPVFWVAGTNKWNAGIGNIASWFDGMGYPLPTLMAYLATFTEIGGAVLLGLGFAVRWVSIPLMITMIVAATTVHWHKGWQAVHDLASPWANEAAQGAATRLDRAKDILQEHGNYGWLTETGNFIVSNNGIEWAATYFVMLLALFFIGGGRYLSVDYWVHRQFRSQG